MIKIGIGFGIFMAVMTLVVGIVSFANEVTPDCRLINPEPSEVWRLTQEKFKEGCRSVKVEFHKEEYDG